MRSPRARKVSLVVLPPRGDTLDALAFGILSRTERDEGEEVIAVGVYL